MAVARPPVPSREPTDQLPPAYGVGHDEPVQASGRSAAETHVAEEVRPPRILELAAIVVISAVAYGWFGHHVIVDQHVVVFDSLDRLTRAFLVWHNDPPKLAAIGFGFPPLTSLIYLPFAAIKPLATSLVALPVLSAICAGLTLAVLDRLFARCAIPAFMRYALLLAFALNPLFVFYAGNGMSDVWGLFLLGFAVHCVISWFITDQPRFIVGAGLAFSLLVLTRYSFAAWVVVVGVLIAVVLARREAHEDEVEGTVITLAAPVVYGLAVWVLYNWLIVGDPIGWIDDADAGGAVNASQPGGDGADLGDVLARLLDLAVGVFPLAFVVVPVLIATGFRRANNLGLGIAALLVLGVVILGANALIQGELGVLAMRNALPVLLLSVIGAAWIYRSLEGLRVVVFIVTLAGLVVSLPLAWNKMRTYPFQNQEQAFVRAVDTGDDQEGTNSIGGFKVGIDSERRMAAYINALDTRNGAVLTDNAQTYGVILLSGRPQLFFDRIDRGDGVFRDVARAPFGRVQFMLLAKNGAQDLLRERYPQLVRGTRSGFEREFETERYLLVRVAGRDPSAPPLPAGGGTQGGTVGGNARGAGAGP